MFQKVHQILEPFQILRMYFLGYCLLILKILPFDRFELVTYILLKKSAQSGTIFKI